MPKLPLKTKMYYGAGGLSMNLCDAVLMQWLMVRYVPPNEPPLVPAALMGAYVFGGRVFEACIGPITGHWSDNFRSPHGRRLPFIRRGMAPLALAFFLLWMPPVAHQHWANSAYILIVLPLYLAMYNLTVTPYLGLLPEITSDPRERVNLTTFQAVFVLLSLVIAAFAGGILEVGGWVVLAGFVAVITVAGFSPVALGIRETYTQPTEAADRPPLFASLRSTLRNRAFRHVVLSTSLYWFGINTIQMLLPFWVIGYLGRSEATVTLVMAPFLISNVLSFFAVNMLAARLGKFAMFAATCLATFAAILLLPLVGHVPFGGALLQTCIVVAIIGIPVAGFAVLPFAILSDVVDYDEQLTGRRRAAIYFGFQGTFQKIALGLSALNFGFFVSGQDGAVSGARLRLLAVMAAVACLIGFFAFLGYPLREERSNTEPDGVDNETHHLR